MDVGAAAVLLSTKCRKPFSLKGFQHPSSTGVCEPPDYRMFCGGAFCAPSWGWPLYMNWSIFTLPERAGIKRKEHKCPAFRLPHPIAEPWLSCLQSAIWSFKHVIVYRSEKKQNWLCCVIAHRNNPGKRISFALHLEGLFLLTSLLHYASSMSFMLHIMVQRQGCTSLSLLPLHQLLTHKWAFKLFLCGFVALKLISSFLYFSCFNKLP